MKALFNLFKKKETKIEEKSRELQKSDIIWINGNRYISSELHNIKVSDIPESKSVYGWALESRVNISNGWTGWSNYSNKVYASMNSALNAVASITPTIKNTHEIRIVALYKMSDAEFRDYKIEKILSENVNPKLETYSKKLYPITAWKVKEDCEVTYNQTNIKYQFKKNTLFIQNEDGNILTIIDQKSPVSYMHKYVLFNYLIKKDLVEEVDVSSQKWAHPHLCKELKQNLKNKI
jgi:hypothetical protein